MSILPHKAKYNTWFYMGGSGVDWTDDCQKFLGSGLDGVPFFGSGLDLD